MIRNNNLWNDGRVSEKQNENEKVSVEYIPAVGSRMT